MSNTDKDKPEWVQAEYFEPYHMCSAYSVRSWQKTNRPCDLPAEPVRKNGRSAWRIGTCAWVPVDKPYRLRWSYRHVPRWFTDHVWIAPQRRAGRDDSRKAIAEYRATGEVDVIHDTRQARHGAHWLWD